MIERSFAGVTVTTEPSETLPDGRRVFRWRLRSATGAGLTVMSLGAVILKLEAPDKNGRLDDVVLGFETAAPYLTSSPYFGAVVGRFANRIAKGRFAVAGKRYQLAVNAGANALHGGLLGFDKQLWRGRRVATGEGAGVQFSRISPDGEEGYPGTVSVAVTYLWTRDDRLIVDYAAMSDAPTPFNISQHSYWNLGGASSASSVLAHNLMIRADRYTSVDKTLIPTGVLADVTGTPFDFRMAKAIGRDIDQADPQLEIGQGYDHNWVLNGEGLRLVASLEDPRSGRRMAIWTDQPGLQFYSGNVLDGVVGKMNHPYPRRGAVALETQHFPDSPNHPGFPSTMLMPGSPFRSRTVFAFSTISAR